MINGTAGRQPGRYSLSLLGGLEDVVAGELEQRLPSASVTGQRFGRLFVDYHGPVEDLTRLRTIENVFARVGELDELPTSPEGLECVRAAVGQMDFTHACVVHDQLHGKPAPPTFRVTGQRSGEHEYTSQEIAAAAGAGIRQRHEWQVNLEEYHYEVVVEVEDDHCTVGLRLTKTALHKRSRQTGGLAALNPTLAYAMGVLSGPMDGETVLDPMCGTGTVLIERHGLGPALLLGSDLFENAIAEARINTEAAGVPVHLIRADARRMPLASGSVDKVICNPPWGRRVLGGRSMWRLYRPVFGEIERVLRPGGLAVILTLQRRLMEELVGRVRGLEMAH
ncbi:MAG TPA: hypothetical protein DGT21_00140, partial [Armatimonadetes bacterium]|nr:hypothetical protein [Armatimonadota bacterium]